MNLSASGVLMFVILIGGLIAVSGYFILRKVQKDKCAEGPAFWCQNPSQWGLCVGDTRAHNFDDYCCHDINTWMAKTGKNDPDPKTNGFNKHCKKK